MQMKTEKEQKYDVSILKMVRNNNIATGAEVVKEYDTYFMLDYFDLLCHNNLIDEDKVYKKYLDISDNRDEKRLNYRAAYKTLSLYISRDKKIANIFQVNAEASHLSCTPFLGIIQINFVYYKYSERLEDANVLEVCETKIRESVDEVISNSGGKCNALLYRSSTSSDFCLVVKSAAIDYIYKLASLINNLVIPYEKQQLIFSTYTNLGIECYMDEDANFYGFPSEAVEENQEYTFALRFTASNDFARKLYKIVEDTKQGKEIVIEPMEGLFGRYDFLLYLSMSQFAQIYPTLCKSKIVGWNQDEQPDTKVGPELITLLQEGMWRGEIRVINERVLVPLDKFFSGTHELHMTIYGDNGHIGIKELDIASSVWKANQEFEAKIRDFNKYEQLFTEERRAFIDISRELWEIISTYVPQGREGDAHVNWQILVSDLNVTFECISSWYNSYKTLQNDVEKRWDREYFLNDLRINVDAINRFYTFLQNVNAQTWQSPLYEIQTQLDAEKMMIAYREFLHEYFEIYKEKENKLGRECPMIYPVVYPDMMIDRACAMETFKRYKTEAKLLICKVPSFEYYGRMFDMIPWILHEASHSLRTMDQQKRNRYLESVVIENVFSQMMYKFLNCHSNDFGYHRLGMLENKIVDIIVSKVIEEFHKYLDDEGKKPVSELPFNILETELHEFLQLIFDQDIFNMGNKGYEVSMKGIKKFLLSHLYMLGILTSDQLNYIDRSEMIEKINTLDDDDKHIGKHLQDLLEVIYDEYYKQLTGYDPEQENDWEILVQSANVFEHEIEKRIKDLGINNADEIRDFCFSMRELNRLYDAYGKGDVDNSKAEEIRNSIWKESIGKIRRQIEEGFGRNEGFTELYRILNMTFGGNDKLDDSQIKRLGDEFNILYQQEVHSLIEREIVIYRETCADLYVAAALGLEAFGYCRQTFQTVSDSGMEDNAQWMDAINVHRFRTVTAVLLGEDNREQFGDTYRISTAYLLQLGKKYCDETIECIKNTKTYRAITGYKKDLAEQFLETIRKNIEILFENFNIETSIHEAVQDSVLSLYLGQDTDERILDVDVQKARDAIVDKYKDIWEIMKEYQYVIYRIKCFILLMDMVGRNGYIEISVKEYDHFAELYSSHKENYKAFAQNPCCSIVAQYYNEPSSAREKTHEIMLEETLEFIQTYYYKNRFKIMASDKAK